MVIRDSDKKSGKFKRRNARLFRDGFDWYYHIREGRRGPFSSKAAAEADLKEYLSTIRFIEENADTLPEDLSADEITHIDIKPPQY